MITSTYHQNSSIFFLITEQMHHTAKFNRKMLSQNIKFKVVKNGEMIVQYKHRMMHMKGEDKNSAQWKMHHCRDRIP